MSFVTILNAWKSAWQVDLSKEIAEEKLQPALENE